MALFIVTNRVITEYRSIIEADSLKEAKDKFYKGQSPFVDLEEICTPKPGYCAEIPETAIVSYCEENGIERDELDADDWDEIIDNITDYPF